MSLKVSAVTAAAMMGSAEAQNALGDMFFKGKGVAQDHREAFGWYWHAADKGHVGAQGEIGRMYQYGQGVSQNYALAQGWFRKAAEQGNAYAETQLASMYESGVGLESDQNAAIEWYRKAADQGFSEAQTRLLLLCRRLAAGDPLAENCLGLLYLTGVPTFYGQALLVVDYQKAAWLFEKAAQQENPDAQHNLATLYDWGHGVPQDFMRAYMWANVAASRAPAKKQSQYDKFRDSVAAKLSQQQLIEAQKLARELVEGFEKRKAVDAGKP